MKKHAGGKATQKGKKAVASLEVRVGDHAKLAPSQKGFQETWMTQESLALRKLTSLSCRALQDTLSWGQNLHVLCKIRMNSMESSAGLWPEFEFSKFFQRVAGACIGTWQKVQESPDLF